MHASNILSYANTWIKHNSVHFFVEIMFHYLVPSSGCHTKLDLATMHQPDAAGRGGTWRRVVGASQHRTASLQYSTMVLLPLPVAHPRAGPGGPPTTRKARRELVIWSMLMTFGPLQSWPLGPSVPQNENAISPRLRFRVLSQFLLGFRTSHLTWVAYTKWTCRSHRIAYLIQACQIAYVQKRALSNGTNRIFILKYPIGHLRIRNRLSQFDVLHNGWVDTAWVRWFTINSHVL